MCPGSSCTPPPLSFLRSSCAHHGFKAQARLLFLLWASWRKRSLAWALKPGSSSSKKPTGVNSPRGFSGLVWPALHVNSLFPSLLDVKILFPIISSPLPTRACAQRDAPEVLKCMLLYLDSCCAGYFPVDAGTWSSVWSAGIRGQRDRGQRGVEAQADSVPSSRSWCAASASSPRTRLHHRLSPAPSSSS